MFRKTYKCYGALTYCSGTLIESCVFHYNTYLLMFLWICSIITIAISSPNNTACNALPFLCIWPVNKAVLLFYMQFCVALYAFRVRYVLLLVSILTSNAPGQWSGGWLGGLVTAHQATSRPGQIGAHIVPILSASAKPSSHPKRWLLF